MAKTKGSANILCSPLCALAVISYNALEFADKATGYYTGKDRRGHNTAPNKIKPEIKQAIIDHIKSYATWVPNKKSKMRYLHHKLSIKQMYDDYKCMSFEREMKFVSSHGYYKSFHEDFRLSFLCNPDPKRGGGGFLHLNPNISHYTGEEPGGFWLHPNGEKLDLSNNMIDLTKSWMRYPSLPRIEEARGGSSAATLANMSNIRVDDESMLCSSTNSPCTVLVVGGAGGASMLNINQTLSYTHLLDPTTLAMLNAGGGGGGRGVGGGGGLCPATATIVRHDFNPTMYDNSLVQAQTVASPSTPVLFRRF